MSQHPEIIAAPLTIWIAPVGTAFPGLSDAPGELWVLLGVNGARSLSGSGVSVTHQHTWSSPPPPAGETASNVSTIESEDLRLRVELLDLTVEQYALAMGAGDVARVARMPGAPGTRSIGLSVATRAAQEFAVLARGPSPYLDGLVSQYELPRCTEAGSPQVVFRRGVPAALAIEFKALPDPSAISEAERFGRLTAQDSTAVVPIAADDGRFLLTSADLFLEI
jgi:hypothetical protein